MVSAAQIEETKKWISEGMEVDLIYFKGEVIDVLRNNLSEVHGFYSNERFVGTIGG